MRYDPDAGWMKYATPGIKSLMLGVCSGIFSAGAYRLYLLCIRPAVTITAIRMLADGISPVLYKASRISAIITIACLIYALIFGLTFTPAKQIQHLVIKKIGLTELGNPLGLKEGEVLPKISCKETATGTYKLVIAAVSTSIEELINISQEISTCLNTKKLCQYAVTQHTADIALNQVTYVIEDVTIHHELVAEKISDLKPDKVTRIRIQDGTSIDLRSSGSILMAGKTRSGKSTAVISMLLQVLSHGRDKYGSEVLIIDPKQAELSRLPHTCRTLSCSKSEHTHTGNSSSGGGCYSPKYSYRTVYTSCPYYSKLYGSEHPSHTSSCRRTYSISGTTYHADKSSIDSNDVLRGTITVKGVSSDPYSSYGGSCISLKTPARAGYTFKGWYGSNGATEDNPSLENPTISASSSGDKVYTAKWELNKYKISYNLHGGQSDKELPSEYTVESDDIALAEPKRKGMKFTGWSVKQ